MIKKITVGFVVQQFENDGTFISQEFIAGDQVDYEDEDGESIDIDMDFDLNGNPYQAFDMVQSTDSSETSNAKNKGEVKCMDV